MDTARLIDYYIGVAVIIIAIVIVVILINKKLKDIDRLRKIGGR